MWPITPLGDFEEWFDNELTQEEQQAVDAAMERLEQDGPLLRRPLVGQIEHSRIHNLKELIPPGTSIRILFVFDSKRECLLLVGGDKRGEWNAWYQAAIPKAEKLFFEYEATRRGNK